MPTKYAAIFFLHLIAFVLQFYNAHFILVYVVLTEGTQKASLGGPALGIQVAHIAACSYFIRISPNVCDNSFYLVCLSPMANIENYALYIHIENCDINTLIYIHIYSVY